MHLFRVGVGMTFSGGIIDLTLFGILQGNRKTNWLFILVVGVAYFVVYFLVFRYLILKRNYLTPGRVKDDETKLYTREDYNKKKKVFMTKQALAVKAFDTDSLFLHADSLFFAQYTITNPDSTKSDSVTYEEIKAYHKTRFYKSDLQGVCDSVVYNALDSMIYLCTKPVIWSDENQSDSITFYNGNIENLKQYKN